MENVAIKAAIGRTNCVLLFAKGAEKIALVTQLTANISNSSQPVRLRFKGDLKISEKTLNHLTKDVLPIIDDVSDLLGLTKNSFKLSITNLGAFSSQNTGSIVSGNSMDLPFLLAVLSSSLHISIDQSLISTGYISSLNGDISMVYGLPEKLKAAENDSRIQLFIHPDIECDSSLEMLTPNEKHRVEAAIAESKRNFRLQGVTNLCDAIEKTFSDEHIVLSSLNHGFFETDIQRQGKPEAIVKIAEHFSLNNGKRLWSSLELQFINSRFNDAKALLIAYIKYNIARRYYPPGFGKKLFNLIASLPPYIRKNKVKFPLLPILECINLSQFATEDNQEDIILLLNVCTGEKFRNLSNANVRENVSNTQAAISESDLLDTILPKISVDTLTKKINGPIDSARACYMLDSTTVESAEKFNHTIVSFYIHLLRHSRKTSEPVDFDAAGPEAFSLLERAFSENGGYKSALAEAIHGYNGGMKFILDTITDLFRKIEQEKYVNHILKSVLDPLDWPGKVDLITSMLERLKNDLPAEITSQPAERYAGNYETLVKSYVQSKDRLVYIFKTL